jgi:hypothetical protein
VCGLRSGAAARRSHANRSVRRPEVCRAWCAFVEGLVGSQSVVDVAEQVDFDREGVAVADGGAVEMFVLQRAEEPRHHLVWLAVSATYSVPLSLVFCGGT